MMGRLCKKPCLLFHRLVLTSAADVGHVGQLSTLKSHDVQ